MSASLVGSEMCIRDSQGAARAAILGEGCEAVAAPPSAAEPGRTRKARQQTPAALGAASARGLGD
eukprot:6585549-Alexandrium_andersonii.AAC.1